VSEDRIVQFRSDGLGLSPAAYGRLLAEIAETRGIDPDNYSREGVVAELEARMAALLGKEAAVFLPTGTLANHLAISSWRAPASACWSRPKATSTTTRATARSN
jgi:threonine aldolase